MIARFIFFILFLPLPLCSQEFSKLESFKKELKKASSEEKRFELQQSLINIYRIYNPDSCFFYTQKNLELIKKNKWNSRKGKTFLGLVSYYTEKNNIKEAFKYNQESFNINTKNKDEYTLSDNYYMFGRLSHQKGEHAEAVRNYLKSIDLGTKSKNLWIVNSAYRSLAFLYLDESNKEKSFENINKALKAAQESNSQEALGFCHGVLAEINRSLGNTKEAQVHFTKAYEYFKNTQNEYGQAWLFTNWSLLDVTKLMESYQMQLKAQEIWDKTSPNHYMSVANHYNIAYTYLDFYKQYEKYQNQLKWNKSQLLKEAQKEFEISKNIAENNNNKQWVMFNYLGMSELSRLQGNLDGYAQNIQEYYNTRDSIYSQSRKNEMAKLESQKIVEQKNKEIIFNKLIIKNKERERLYYILALFSLLTIGILMFFLYKQSKKNSNRLQKLNIELDKANKINMKFFGILNHDLRSPVAGLIHFLHLQKEAPEMMDDETKKRLEDKVINASEKLLQQMEDLLLWSKGQMDHFSSEIKTVFIKDIFKDIEENFSWVENIDFKFDFPENMSILTDQEYLKTITRNLTGNAVKVLEQKEGDKTILWKAFSDENKNYISITDNGEGASVEKFKALFDDSVTIGTKKGLGLHLIRDLSRVINMEIDVKTEQNHGSTITLSTKKV
ncbi:signal transduction histidine kinase [Chryseobacterium ginsenosidimutans]|uniref:tetratricopeptide repeat-containing sensor histidine kinase n=1 Tax=Chryseobacterium ginsenosidimutans TaxID=687846 RepID=UPI00278357D1|nr:tetratricopeptide repeat-containing sensor histidine kinase [Chryseobacterium ginsenosidimutans]MDQ0592363.1 signal transduction histidine kinase [Chryseobacterium ginsenosidimutans]